MKKFLLYSALACLQMSVTVSAAEKKPTLNWNAKEDGTGLVLPVSLEQTGLSFSGPMKQKAYISDGQEEGDGDGQKPSDNWEYWGEGTMSDFLIAQYYGLSGKEMDVTFERNVDDPNTFRIVEPYKNWSDPNLEGKVKYDSSKAKPMVFHFVASNNRYVWFEQFDTGVELIEVPESTEEQTYYTGEALCYPTILQLGSGSSFTPDEEDMLISLVPKFFCRNFNGNLTLGAIASFGANRMPAVYLAVDTGEETQDGYTAWYYPANTDGSFYVLLPHSEEEEANWKEIGEGNFTDVIFSSLFTGIDPESWKVKFEQNTEDPNTYRIRAPYENWNNPLISSYFTYNPKRSSPMVFHVVGDGKYVWFEEFDTGIYMNYSEDDLTIRGEITMLHQAESFILNHGLDVAVDQYHKILCDYDNGNMTLDAYCYLMSTPIYNILFSVGVVENQYRGNIFGDFFVSLPDAQTPNPNRGWNTIGNAAFRDAFTEAFNGNAPAGAGANQTLFVEMQQNIEDPRIFRIVNPYATWQNIYGNRVTYDEGRTYYMYIYTVPDDGKACLGNFYTGLTLEGYGAFGVYTDAGPGLSEYGIDHMYENYPEMFGNLKDGIFTCPIKYKYQGKTLYSFYGWFGYMLQNPTFYILNESGNFFIAFPESGVENVEMEEAGDVEYFNLQGVKLNNPEPGQIVIRKEGSKVSKTVVR